MINFDKNTQLEDLLARIAESIQLDDTRKNRMESAYKAIEDLLNNDNDFFKQLDFEVYPQGSISIGTTVKPTAKNEFDLDIVVHLLIDWVEYNPETVYNNLKRVLLGNENYKDKVQLKNRCIRLNYAGDFHMDILVGCQEFKYDENKLVVPDQELGDWTSSNPRGYGNWFTNKANLVKISLLEKAINMEKLPVEDFAKKKPLQRAVQLIKMYRDQYFIDNIDKQTSSIILTTITGELYNGEDSIFKTIDNMIQKVKQKMGTSSIINNRIKILNPVNPQEDFTDKWAEDKEPELYEHFIKFINHLDLQWQKLKEENGVIQESKVLTNLFGEVAFSKGQKSQLDYIENARKSNTLSINRQTGSLTSSSLIGSSVIKPNTFFGK